MMFISIVLFKSFIVENTKILQIQHKTIEIRRKMWYNKCVSFLKGAFWL